MNDITTCYESKLQPETAQAFIDSLDSLEYSAVFIPFSQSRHKGDKNRCLNWRVTIGRRNAPAACTLITDYMQGIAHIPNYNFGFARVAEYAGAVRRICETGINELIQHKNAYDACQAERIVLRKKPLPKPKLVDVLYCLVMDSSVLDHPNFQSWVDEYGYDADSRKAENIYNECLQQTLILRQMLDLDAAREAFENF